MAVSESPSKNLRKKQTLARTIHEFTARQRQMIDMAAYMYDNASYKVIMFEINGHLSWTMLEPKREKA